jgi:hypothetical protein
MRYRHATKEAVDPLIRKEYLCELADAYVPVGIGRKDPRISLSMLTSGGFRRR